MIYGTWKNGRFDFMPPEDQSVMSYFKREFNKVELVNI